MMQKEVTCRRCGKPIWLVRDENTGKWIACDKEIRRFEPVKDGGAVYMTGDGVSVRGVRSTKSNTYGYRRHRSDCTAETEG